MKILILSSSLADYTVACYKSLSLIKGLEITLVYQQPIIDAPYSSFDLSFCKKTIVDNYQIKSILFNECKHLDIDCILMASWNFPQYMRIAKYWKKKGVKVISTFDGQWRCTIKQCIGIITSKIFLKPAIDNFFVPGDRQATFARKLGYKNPRQGLYCANSSLFTVQLNLVKKFIFIGRLIGIKGVDLLLDAYADYRKTVLYPWDLIIVGEGAYKSKCESLAGVTVKGFMQPNELPTVLNDASCLILPSKFEPWGVVVHEAVLSGLLVICSNNVGSSTWFVRDGLNGLIINLDVSSLTKAMCYISQLNDKELSFKSQISRQLGELWTNDKWAEHVYLNILKN
jgi:glycosyltransferase involved in cell wall biosynthesis